ncbi:MAG: tetratricopeptide repeat protein [Proteobacteria bacterium]|nr:tetratricopeptide repeat protein [Pseudomonadota bacterium]
MLVPSMRWIGLLVPVLAVPWQLEAQVPAAPAPPVSSGSRTPARPGTVAPSAARPAASAAAPAARAQDVPWAGTSDVTGLGTLPTFLQTAAKEKSLDQRPDPTPQQLAALEELQAEVKHFGMVGSAFRDTMGTLLRRDYMRQRRNRDLSFKRQIEHEEHLEDGARANAIELFERFLGSYPRDPKYSPDAMFRLGELYFERSAIRFQREMDAYLTERERLQEHELSDSHLQEPAKSFLPTIDLYTQLVKTFPDYKRLDGVYYLIGYCLNEMGKPEAARLAWLSLVCSNEFTYRGEPVAAKPEQPDDPSAKQHPALTMDEPEPKPKAPFVDPYAKCNPIGKGSRFFAESWLRIGEYHFDYDFSERGLEQAISAYKKVLSRPEDRNYNLALYKVAWAHYRASHYPEAISHFAKLVQWSDDERKRTGKAGTELRAEAIQYLGIAFAYDDWNENQIGDPAEGLPRGIDRVQNANLLAQDRPWTAEVYFQLGNIYFDEAKYADAIDVWRLALGRWPLHYRAPEIQNMVARAFTRDNQMDKAVDARSKLASYAQGGAWWDANMDHPREQRQAEELAEDSLINTAVYQHQKAQRLRRRCVEQKEPDLCRRAQAEYGIAARAYRQYIKNYPNNPQAYELQYNLADALYWSENYESAAREYAAVRDSNLDDTYLSVSARLVVEANKRLIEQAERAGQLQLRSKPPDPQGAPPSMRPAPMPQLIQRLAQAREIYRARVQPAQDKEGVRESYRYNNALLLYQYGYWTHAKQRLRTIFDERCVGPDANETGRVAWLNLRNMAVALQDNNEVRRLGQELSQRQCTFAASGMRRQINCADPANQEEPQCLAGADLTNLRYQDAVRIFAQAEQTAGDEQRHLYEKAATELVKAVNAEPNHPQAPLALEKAAIALERTSRFESAGRLYQRIIDEVGPRKGKDGQEQASLDAILGNAYFRMAFNANRFFDYERAVDNYRLLADSPRFASSQVPETLERREGALINAAKILEYQQQYSRAAEYYRRAAEMLRDPKEQRVARYRVAEMSYKQQRYGYVIRNMRAFIERYRRDRDAGELVVQAYWRIAEARKALAQKVKDQRRALEDVAAFFAQSGQAPGSFAAEYAAQARFLLVDRGSVEFEQFAIKPGAPRTLERYVKSVMAQIKSGGEEAKRRAEAYNTVPGYRRPLWTIAAFVRQGRIYEVLARGVLNTPFVMPQDLKKKIRRAPADLKDEVRAQVEDRIRQVLDAQVRPIECLAVARYALAARAARAGNIDNKYTRSAIDRINAYGDERIAECVAEAAARDPSFAQYAPGEFSRAPRGRNLGIRVGVSPPAFARGQR